MLAGAGAILVIYGLSPEQLNEENNREFSQTSKYLKQHHTNGNERSKL